MLINTHTLGLLITSLIFIDFVNSLMPIDFEFKCFLNKLNGLGLAFIFVHSHLNLVKNVCQSHVIAALYL